MSREITGVEGINPATLMKIEIQVSKGKVPKDFKLDMSDQLSIDKNDLRGEMLRQASNYGFLAVCAELAMAKRDRLEHELEDLKSKTYFKLKGGGYQSIYTDKVTEQGLRNAVQLDDDVKLKTEEFLEARKQAGLLMACKSALDQKRNMLMSINASMRKEWEDTK